MKTYKFIVINKNKMTELYHFSTIEQVSEYFCFRKLKNHLIVIDERYILNTDSIASLTSNKTTNLRDLEISLESLTN